MKRLCRSYATSALLFLMLIFAWVALTAHAHAQTITANQNVNANPAKFASYSASFTAIAPASSATDFMTLTGSASKTIFLRGVDCSGISTAAATGTIALVQRSTADTGGTKITASATAGGQIVPLDSNDPAASAAIAGYSANPTTGTLIGVVRSGRISTNTTTGAPSTTLSWRFGFDGQKSPTLRGASQVLALNGLTASFAAGTALSCTMSWVEQ